MTASSRIDSVPRSRPLRTRTGTPGSKSNQLSEIDSLPMVLHVHRVGEDRTGDLEQTVCNSDNLDSR